MYSVLDHQLDYRSTMESLSQNNDTSAEISFYEMLLEGATKKMHGWCIYRDDAKSGRIVIAPDAWGNFINMHDRTNNPFKKSLHDFFDLNGFCDEFILIQREIHQKDFFFAVYEHIDNSISISVPMISSGMVYSSDHFALLTGLISENRKIVQQR